MCLYKKVLFIITLNLFVLFSLTFAPAKAIAASDIIILIYLEDNRLYLINNNIRIKDYPISAGMPGWPSPAGTWEITDKSDWGEGFGGYWLGLSVYWGDYGIHGTLYEGGIGYDVSHGCIRMKSADIAELYELVPVGTEVIIVGGPFGPFGMGFREIIPGDRGSDVSEIQKKLKELGYYSGRVTGIYEDDLKSAIYKFQKEKKLPVKYTVTREDYISMGFIEFE